MSEYAVPSYAVANVFLNAAMTLGLHPTGHAYAWPNGDGTQHFIDSQGQPVVLLWQYGKVWLGRKIELEEKNMPTQDELRAALEIMWQAHEMAKAHAEVRLLALRQEREELRDELALVDQEIQEWEDLRQKAWDATSQFNAVKTALGLEGN